VEKESLMAFMGNKVRDYRMARNLTQNDLAQLVNKNASAITRIEGGTRMMSVPMLREVALALNISTDALLYEPKASIHMANIIALLAGQSERNLEKVERIVGALIDEYGEVEEKISDL